MPFQFPDPNVQNEVVHPVTGETWHYHDGAWEVEDSNLDPVIPSTHSHPTTHAPYSLTDEVDQNEEQLQQISTALFNVLKDVNRLKGQDITNELAAIETAQAEIIERKAKDNT